MTTIADRISIAQSRINQAALKCARTPNEIQLLAVSKTKPKEDIIAAYQAGQRKFGENYVQEGEQKITTLRPLYPDIEWHFIGPLQSNKTRVVAEHFDWMHTISRDKIAARLNQQRPSTLAPLNVCIQVNISQESSKSGVALSEVMALAESISSMDNLLLRGLMAIPTATSDIKLQQQEFSQLNNAYQALAHTYSHIDTLSMGMSNDLDSAIENGSTMVRIGSAIFGSRT
ncbi:YggS family pyridoxal phosphate-dependent enzyme [Shewanella intestini]|uniref:Pyridoxal phosphate homeostasis protein n=1 Tax=Shewanella intestini TaxID=2017544 RepID=A0ABS5I2H3_9GAMM|nr:MULTISPECIES: YggS family pyridoxal phosphate-dependent enzyme [Shewanella]MBR9728221.1 YggS family pyridoxal phosphate-dependent enzyme [Shewanella intestini]MRG35686.1 YggS family pyridoxal phosphate-dependent enzyme [Shewanella sp. XMDDZSB0408]